MQIRVSAIVCALTQTFANRLHDFYKLVIISFFQKITKHTPEHKLEHYMYAQFEDHKQKKCSTKMTLD